MGAAVLMLLPHVPITQGVHWLPPVVFWGVAGTAARRRCSSWPRWRAGEARKHQEPSAHPTASQHWSPQDGLAPSSPSSSKKEFRLIKTTYPACFPSRAEIFACDCTTQEILLEETAAQRVSWLWRSLPGIRKVWVTPWSSWWEPGISATNPSIKHCKSSPKHGAAHGFFCCFPVPIQLMEMGKKQLKMGCISFQGLHSSLFRFLDLYFLQISQTGSKPNVFTVGNSCHS